MTTNDQSEFDNFLPNKKVCSILGVGSRTVHRYERDDKLNFPKPTWIRGRKYQRASEIRGWQKDRSEAHTAKPQSFTLEG